LHLKCFAWSPDALKVQKEEQMGSLAKTFISILLSAALIFFTNTPIQAQEQEHVVPRTDLRNDLAQAAEIRHRNEADVRGLLSSEVGQKALQSAHIDYEKVDQAVSQLSDEELARMAQQSRQLKADFAAGRLSNGAIIAIVVVIAVVIILVVLFSQLNHS
jgi:hypothetical protein